MDREKGILDIPKIDSLLREKGIGVQWTIIGDGPDKSQLQNLVISRDNFSFFSPPDNKSVMELVVKNDVFILPSRLDGLPVALLETMSAGCVPVISEFNHGIRNVVSPEEGFIVPVGDNQQFADRIALLNADRTLLEKMSQAARAKIERDYDVKQRAKDYYDLFNKYKEFKRPPRFHFHRYAGWLDYPFVPPAIKRSVTKIRRIIAK
jgi:glycosyltransferase involved in cell wall biosynthesis